MLLQPRRRSLLAILEDARRRGDIAEEAEVDRASLMLIGWLVVGYLSGEDVDAGWLRPDVELVVAALR